MLCHPQLPVPFFDGFRSVVPEAQDKAIAAAKLRAKRDLALLNDHTLGRSRTYLCGETISITDYLAFGMVSVGEVIGCTFSRWPNVVRWY